MMGNSKIQHQCVLTQNRVLKNSIIHQPKVESCKEKYKIKRERIITFSAKNMRENNKFIEN